MPQQVKGGSLGYSVIVARYRQHFLAFNLVILAVLLIMQPSDDAPPAGENGDFFTADQLKALQGSFVAVLAAMAVSQYWMDGYAIKHLRLHEKKLFG